MYGRFFDVNSILAGVIISATGFILGIGGFLRQKNKLLLFSTTLLGISSLGIYNLDLLIGAALSGFFVWFYVKR